MTGRSWLQDYYAQPSRPSARQLEKALKWIGYDFGYDEERDAAVQYLTRLRQRWGNITASTLVAIAHRFTPVSDERAFNAIVKVLEPETSEERDVLFALAILGVMRLPESPQALLPYLSSPRAQERWLSAMGLAQMGDERALDTLGQMLIEFMGPNQPQRLDGSIIDIFRLWHMQLPRILANWGDQGVVPLLRTALVATTHAEESEVPEPYGPESTFIWSGQQFTGREAWRQFHSKRKYWIEEEHRLIYALGWIGAFGALIGIPIRSGVYYSASSWGGEYLLKGPLPASHAGTFRGYIWRVHACLGALEKEFSGQLRSVYTFADAPDLRKAVERLLVSQFGLDKTALHQAIEDYDQAGYTYTTANDYRRFAELAQEEAADEEDISSSLEDNLPGKDHS